MTKFKPMACGFHCHSDIGSLDGGSTVKLLVDRHAELGRPAMCLTDHGTINGLATSHECCKKKKLLSIHGIEAYVINPIEPTKKNKRGDEVPNFSHLTIHFVSQKAYQYFCRLTPIMEERAVIIFGEKKPLITWEELEAISDEIVVGSGCLVSFCQQYILNGRPDMAELFYQKIRSLVKPGRFYVEIFPHQVTHNWQKPTKDHNGVYVPGKFVPNECQNGVPKNIQMAPNKFVLEMARKYGDRVVISEDGHLATKEEKICQDVRLGNGSTEAWKFYETYSLEATDVWAERLQSELDISDKEMEEIIDNSYHFTEHFKDYKFKTKDEGWEIPNVITVYGDKYEGKSTKEILKVLIKEHGRFPKPDHPRFQEYRDRLQSEVALFADNGHIDLLPYFFTLEDVCSWARKNNVLVSCRGSAAGALVTYLLGMSVTDPIKWELPVERMLNIPRIVEAKDLPDIDLDFDRKDLVMEYLKTKYGDRFAPISINSLMKVKAAIRDVERLEKGSVSLETELMCRNLPNTTVSDSLKWLNGYRDEETDSWVPGFLEDQSNAAEALRQYVKNNPELWEKITRCLGVFRQKSIHACFHGETLVQDQSGTRYIKDLSGREGFSGDKKIRVWRSGVKKTIRLCMNSGISIRCTPDHVFFTTDGREVEAQNLSKDDLLVFEKFTKTSGTTSFPNDWCFFMGWALNDGGFGEKQCNFHFTPTKDSEIIDVFRKWTKGDILKSNRPDRWAINTKRVLGEYEGCFRPEHDIVSRRLPSYFWTLSLESQKDFMSGLWSANGFVLTTIKRVGIKVASADLISDIVIWLSSHGVSSSCTRSIPHAFVIRGKEFTNSGAYCLTINMTAESGESFVNAIKFKQSYKQERLREIYEQTRPSRKQLPKTVRKTAHKVYFREELEDCEVFDFNEPTENKAFIGGYLVHNCGVLIANSPIQDLVPMTKINDRYATGYCPKGCAYVGLVKFDMLGVTTLEALNISMNSIAKSEGGEKLVWGEFPTVEADYEKIFKPMKTSRLFQVATTTMTPFVRAIQPRKASDLSNICALIRPGTLNAPSPNPDKPEYTAAEYFVLCQQGKEEPYYIHNDLKPILQETHGVVLFQEQSLRIFRDLAGYSYGDAEQVRRAIGKKIKDLMEIHLGILKSRLIERGWSKEQTDLLIKTLIQSSSYSFNKSHSASYGVVGNNGVYIKSRYPLHFYLGELTVNSGDRDKIKDIMRECADLILQPDILKSHPTDWCIENGRLRAPLVIVKRVGEKTAKGIVELLKNKGEGYEIKRKSNRASKDTSPHIAITGSCIINIDSSEHSDREGDNPGPADKGRPEIKSIE